MTLNVKTVGDLLKVLGEGNEVLEFCPFSDKWSSFSGLKINSAKDLEEVLPCSKYKIIPKKEYTIRIEEEYLTAPVKLSDANPMAEYYKINFDVQGGVEEFVYGSDAEETERVIECNNIFKTKEDAQKFYDALVLHMKNPIEGTGFRVASSTSFTYMGHRLSIPHDLFSLGSMFITTDANGLVSLFRHEPIYHEDYGYWGLPDEPEDDCFEHFIIGYLPEGSFDASESLSKLFNLLSLDI